MSQRLIGFIIVLVTACISLGYGLYVVSIGYMDYPKYLPDDAFYYLQNARVLSEYGIHSFDNGFSINTGYHLLWFYCVTGLSMLVNGDPGILLMLSTALGWAISLLSLVLAVTYCYRRYPAALVALAVVLSGYGYINGQISAMEWPLCIAISTLIYLVLIGEELEKKTVCFFLLGFFGSLVRADFGGVAVALLVAAYITQIMLSDKRAIKPAWGLLAGAIVGFLIVGMHNYIVAGDWLSTSARMKQQWEMLHR